MLHNENGSLLPRCIHPVDCKTRVLRVIPEEMHDDLPRMTLEKGGRRGMYWN